MLVSQILKGKGANVYTTSPNETVEGAAAMLHARRVGAVVVMDGAAVIGILSERDLVAAVAEKGAAALGFTVSDCMTRDVVFAEPTETVDALLARMTDRRMRHLPVCKDDQLIGIVSIGDLVKSKIADTEAEAEGLKAYIATG